MFLYKEDTVNHVMYLSEVITQREKFTLPVLLFVSWDSMNAVTVLDSKLLVECMRFSCRYCRGGGFSQEVKGLAQSVFRL